MKFPEKYRWQQRGHPMDTFEGDPHGVFIVRHKGKRLKIIATDGTDKPEDDDREVWEHVSVSNLDYWKSIPTWNDMCFVKNLFWGKQECVVQYHPAEMNYVNNHHGCLHLWRSTEHEFPMPPKEFV